MRRPNASPPFFARLVALVAAEPTLPTAAIRERTGAPESLVRKARRQAGVAAPGTFLGSCGTAGER